jgi:two-component system sensor histidine kinase DesK
MTWDVDRPTEKAKVVWWPLVFTVFVAFVFLEPYQRKAGRLEWGLTIGGVAVFVALYLYGLVTAFRRQRSRALAAISGITALGLVFAPFNAGAALYIIYSTSFAPFVVGGEIGTSVAVIGTILAAVALESWLLHLGWVFFTYSFVYAIVLGVGNTYSARQAFSTERVAKADERQRIARDLHDVLGHTLSVIVLKAELAGRLLDRDKEGAKAEIADVERISRDALAEVRQAISGYLTGGLPAELERAKATLETAGVGIQSHSAHVGVTPAQERVLALVLREAVTNVVRHARAKVCRLSLTEADGACRLVVEDDGRGGVHAEGHGIRGMRERIDALGGTLRLEGDRGTRLTITLPTVAPATGDRPTR